MGSPDSSPAGRPAASSRRQGLARTVDRVATAALYAIASVAGALAFVFAVIATGCAGAGWWDDATEFGTYALVEALAAGVAWRIARL